MTKTERVLRKLQRDLWALSDKVKRGTYMDPCYQQGLADGYGNAGAMIVSLIRAEQEERR